MRSAAGAFRDMEVIPSDLRQDPAVGGFVLTCRDVTARNELEQALRDAHRLEAIGQLAGGVAHDFNNSLSVILACAEGLADVVPEGQRQDVESIRSAARSSAALTRRLLDFARKEPGVVRPVEVPALLQSLAGMLRRTLPRNIAVEVDVPAGVELLVLGDRSEIEHALLNLALNARDAMPGGGKLTLSCRPRTLEADEAAERPGIAPGPVTQIDVEDTGTGIAPDVLPRIFEPLFTTKPPGKGTGLGLSSVYGVVRGHRGTIDVYTEPGRGTRFSLLFPAAAEGVRPAPTLQPRPGMAIVADDNPAQRAAGRKVALALFDSVLEAADGAEALEQVEQRDGQVAALIADYDMPDMTGGELAAAVRERWPAVAVVVTSGLHRDVAGARLLRKPFTASELDAVLPAGTAP
jgi:signal transduction histidine kinase/CheY-like chemotaxis protein